ncbi:MAG: hypothetical protein R3C49_09200 [Planctomycetaceae bacterium]
MTRHFCHLRMMRTATVAAIGYLLLASADCSAQLQRQPYHQPLSQHSAPGQAAGWMNAVRNYDPGWLQPVMIEVPGGGSIQVYNGAPVPSGAGYSPVIAAISAGHLYRLRISDMPKFPGLEIFPSIELLDHLHPPAGREDEFPIPVILTAKDILAAQQGNLVTRVIYLEQPQIAQHLDPLRREIPQVVSGSQNALQEADRLGRPMAILRIGGRQASVNAPPGFFGNGGGLQVREAILPEPQSKQVVRGDTSAPVRRISHSAPGF